MRASREIVSLLTPILIEMGHQFPSNASVEPPKDKKFGDMACNCAFILAKEAGCNPRDLATALAEKLRAASSAIADVSIAGPGFLNITFMPEFWQECIHLVEGEGERYGSSTIGAMQKVQVEFVSANPTGPLHIGHGRGAAIGDSLARILRFAGYDVETEYYLNDAGLQMRTLGLSVWLRVKEIAKISSEPFPETCYQGEYILTIAKDLLDMEPLLPSFSEAEGIDRCYQYGMDVILQGIKTDLHNFNVHHDVWFSELSLTDSGAVESTLATLKEKKIAFEKDNALWFNTTDYGDDKDRVLKKSDGSLTYFSSDIAYHANKYDRGFSWVIDVWGADHHGYIPRMRAAVTALGQPQSSFDVVLVQLVNLLRDGKQVAMSTRAGLFETLADVITEVGSDAARFIFLSRKSDSKLDFDLNLVKQRTMDNPVYYVQYAHARVCTLMRRAHEQGITSLSSANLSLLTKPEELELLQHLDRFPKVVKDAASSLSSHFISQYLLDLAGLMHKYYSVHSILKAEHEDLITARLRLLQATGQTIKNGLSLLGVSAPESM